MVTRWPRVPTLIPPLPRSDHADVQPPALPQRWPLMQFTPHDDFGDSADTSWLPDEAIALVAKAGPWSRRNGHRGFVPDSQVTLLIRGDGVAAAELLVRAGIWRRVAGGYQFVRWDGRWCTAEQGAPVAVTAVPAARGPLRRPGPARRPRQALYRDKALRQAVRSRDGDRCRFCAVTVRWGAGRARDSGTWELIDRDGEMAAQNIVVACVGCSASRKRGELLELAAGTEVVTLPGATLGSVTGDGSVTGSEDAGQKRHGKRHAPADFDLDLDLSEEGSNPQNTRSQSKSKSAARAGRDASGQPRDASPGDASARDASGSKPRKRKGREEAEIIGPVPGTPEFRVRVQAAMAARNCDNVTDADADSIAAEALPKAKVQPVLNPWLFMATTIAEEPDPYGRWLAGRPRTVARAGQPDPEWCRKCDQYDRTIETAQGISKCPACHPALVVPRWAAAG